MRCGARSNARSPCRDRGLRVPSFRDLHYDGPGRLNRSIDPGENLAGVCAKRSRAGYCYDVSRRSESLPKCSQFRSVTTHARARLPRSWRRYLRFSVRSLIVLVLVIGCWLGWLVRSARIQREAVAEIRAAGGEVWYDWEWKDGKADPGTKSLDARWLAKAPESTISVTLSLPKSSRTKPMRRDGPGWASQRKLEYLKVNIGGLTDRGLMHLEGLTNLSEVDVGYTQVTDLGLAHLKRLTNLRASISAAPRSLARAWSSSAALPTSSNSAFSRPVSRTPGWFIMKGLDAASQPSPLGGTQCHRRWAGPDLAGLAIPDPICCRRHSGRPTRGSGPPRRARPISRGLSLGRTQGHRRRVSPTSKAAHQPREPRTSGGTQDRRAVGLGQPGSGLHRLESLDLQDTQVTTGRLVHLKGLTSLVWLSVDNTTVGDPAVKYLKCLPKLTTLRIDNTKITDSGLEQLRQELPRTQFSC